jgi:hypothetical protein
MTYKRVRLGFDSGFIAHLKLKTLAIIIYFMALSPIHTITVFSQSLLNTVYL